MGKSERKDPRGSLDPKNKPSSSSSESESVNSGDSSADSAKFRKEMKKLKKKIKREERKTARRLKKKLKNEKRKLKKSKKSPDNHEKNEVPMIPVEIPEIQPAEPEKSCNIPIGLMERSKTMAPMTKEEWEKRQSVVRKVLDEESGRYRLIKGDGEVLEEIVPWKKHKEINKQATMADGAFFQKKSKTRSK